MAAAKTVPSVRLKSVLAERPVDLLKLDVEGAEFEILADCGHYPAIENPQDFNAAVLNFLAGASAYSR